MERSSYEVAEAKKVEVTFAFEQKNMFVSLENLFFIIL